LEYRAPIKFIPFYSTKLILMRMDSSAMRITLSSWKSTLDHSVKPLNRKNNLHRIYPVNNFRLIMGLLKDLLVWYTRNSRSVSCLQIIIAICSYSYLKYISS
jgi:hypothetical protein